MDVYTIIDTLVDYINKSSSIPFSKKAILDRAELLEIITAIQHAIPEDIKQAKRLKEERQRILSDASREAETLVKETEKKMASMIEQNEITQKAYAQSEEILNAAKNNARDIKAGAKQYADAILAKVEDRLKEAVEVIKNNREELK
jgi:vacuolar-type H+-ATPase subunit H